MISATMLVMERNIRYFLYGTVFLTGLAVLVVEVTAVRILSPYFGSSLYVLSSVLTVILGALSVGYYVGGKLSDRYPRQELLFGIIALSGVTVLASEFASLLLLPYTESIFSIITGPLFLAMVLFFTPAFLLGIVSPYVIKLQSLVTKSDEIGSVVGATFFWGTFGSITGSLLTGFVLVPFLGITLTVVSTGVGLCVLGLGGMFVVRSLQNRGTVSTKIWRFVFVIVLTATILFLLIESIAHAYAYPYTVVHRSDGLYSQLLVYEMDYREHDLRVLKQDTNNSSATYLDSYDLVFGYTQFAEFYQLLKPDTKHFLMIGAGSYSIPRTLVARNPTIQVTVSDLEPTLLPLAQEYFDLSDITRIQSVFIDGRVFLSRSTTTYDVIFGDAFGTDLSIPAHLATQEFFTEVKEHLTDEGIFMMNYIGTLQGETPTLTGSLTKTLRSVFPNLAMYVFEKDKPNERQNIMFIARNGSSPIELPDVQVLETNGARLTVEDMEILPSALNLKDEFMLTDDHAPVEYLMLAQQ